MPMNIDIASLPGWLGAVTAAGSILELSIRLRGWQRERRRLAGRGGIPAVTLQLAAPRPGYWHSGGGEPAAQLRGHVRVRNCAALPARVAGIELRYGWRGRWRAVGALRSGRRRLAPGASTDLTFEFWLYPPPAPVGRTFTAHSLSCTDQFGHRHVLRRVRFEPGTIIPEPAAAGPWPAAPADWDRLAVRA